MIRKKITALVILLLWGCSLASGAEKVTISILYSSPRKAFRESARGFKDYFNNRDLSLQIKSHILKENNSDNILGKVRKEKPDLIFAVGTKALKLAGENTSDIPVVFSMVLNPKNLNRERASGVSMNITALDKIQKLREFFPEFKKIGVIYSADTKKEFKKLEKESQYSDFQIIGKEISEGKDFPEALSKINRQIDCFMMIPSPEIYFNHSIQYLLEESLKEKFPVIGLSSYYTKAGAFISFDSDYRELGKQAGEIAHKIIDGKSPREIKIKNPEKINYSLNVIVADNLGIDVPGGVKENATEVFK
ncbi:MAG: ABC transporter substrate-binding protein [Elusimicrobiota bacterium]